MADTCEYHKPQYPDYSPEGMPDFDQKQLNWQDVTGQWSHDGPCALANCLWWFDSKFEPNPIDPRPFFPGAGSPPANDGYPLLTSYGMPPSWDDHDTNNVQPFVSDLATNYLATNYGGSGGTTPMSMQNGLRAYLSAKGMSAVYKDTAVPSPSFTYLKGQVLDCQDVILLLGFYENLGATSTPLGWHWVTVAGVCTTQTQLCISDPWLDGLEGEPPAGSVHGGTVHNDALNISGPHAQIQHDPYQCTSSIPPGWAAPIEVISYPVTAAEIGNFAGMNVARDFSAWQGGPVFVTIDIALVICPAEVMDTCDYYKLPYGDYAPNGVPDFDQKQDAWTNPANGAWSHCGPVALANCLWWFDSKFEPNPIDPRPFYPGPGNPAANDGYALVSSFDPAGAWDDHDTNNVMPLVDSMALYCKTNTIGGGTLETDLAQGAQKWIDSVGLNGYYSVRLFPIDGSFGFDSIRHEVLISQDVILLLGFWEEVAPGYCERIGGHYVTVAGTCTNPADSALCISDPYYDMHEGEPPAGSAHGSSVHNDAFNISGPHGTIHHDRYNVIPSICQPMVPPFFQAELANYPVNAANVAPWYGQNQYDPTGASIPPQGGLIHTIVEFAVIICPDTPAVGACCIQTTGACYVTDSLTCVGAGHDYQGSGTNCTPNPCDTCDYQFPGDVDNDGVVGVSDMVYLVSYLYAGGAAPVVPANADPTGDCCVDYNDVWYLVQFLFFGGPAPVNCTCVNPPLCLPPAPPHTVGIVRHNLNGYLPPQGNPVGTPWHELWPSYCQTWTATGWADNGDGILSFCDTLDFFHALSGWTSREHVELVTPTLKLVATGAPFDTMYVDLISPPDPLVNPIVSPVGTFWHEVYPNYCTKYVLAFWYQFAAAPLQVGHVITLQNLATGGARNFTVVAIETDVVTTPVPTLGDEYDHNLDGYSYGNPTGSTWLELHPGYGLKWTVNEWRDNGSGTLDYCDTLKFVGIPVTDSVRWKHVEYVTQTLKLNKPGTFDTLYFDYLTVNPLFNFMANPLGTFWHEVWPTLCQRTVCLGWTDNGSGVLDSCDFITLEYVSGPDSGIATNYHVEALNRDIVTTIIPAPSCCNIRGDINHSGSGPDISDLVYLVTYMFQGGPQPPCIPEADINGSGGGPDISDLVYLVTYMFQGGPAPVPCP